MRFQPVHLINQMKNDSKLNIFRSIAYMQMFQSNGILMVYHLLISLRILNIILENLQEYFTHIVHRNGIEILISNFNHNKHKHSYHFVTFYVSSFHIFSILMWWNHHYVPWGCVKKWNQYQKISMCTHFQYILVHSVTYTFSKARYGNRIKWENF